MIRFPAPSRRRQFCSGLIASISVPTTGYGNRVAEHSVCSTLAGMLGAFPAYSSIIIPSCDPLLLLLFVYFQVYSITVSGTCWIMFKT